MARTLKNSTPTKKRPLTALKRKNEANNLSSSNVVDGANALKKKKKRQLLSRPIPSATSGSANEGASSDKNQAKVQIPPSSTPSTSTPSPSSPVPAPVTKRSIRASSRAIANREKKRLETKSPTPPPLDTTEEKPAIRKKRKLNSQKTIIPTVSSDALVFEETGNISYSEYAESSSFSAIPRPANKPNIIIGVPSKQKRKLMSINKESPTPETVPKTVKPNTHNRPSSTSSSTASTRPTIEHSLLDLSHHSILPNSSYIAHLPNSQRKKVNPIVVSSESNESNEFNEDVVFTMADTHCSDIVDSQYSDNNSDSSSEFFDAPSDFDLRKEDISLSSQEEKEDISLSSQEDILLSSQEDKEETISYRPTTTSSSSLLSTAENTKDIPLSQTDKTEATQDDTEESSKKKFGGFWNAVFKSFSK